MSHKHEGFPPEAEIILRQMDEIGKLTRQRDELREALDNCVDQIERDGEIIPEDAADKSYRADVLRIARSALERCKGE